MIKQQEKLAPLFTIDGKYVRSSGFRPTREWDKRLKRALFPPREYFRVCDGGKWKYVSPSQRWKIQLKIQPM